jgi:hypothetical protein
VNRLEAMLVATLVVSLALAAIGLTFELPGQPDWDRAHEAGAIARNLGAKQ